MNIERNLEGILCLIWSVDDRIPVVLIRQIQFFGSMRIGSLCSTPACGLLGLDDKVAGTNEGPFVERRRMQLRLKSNTPP